MDDYQYPISPYRAELSFTDLRRMIRVVQLLHGMSGNPRYRAALEDELPDSARKDPGYFSVMMGYDFHLSETGPKLIEVNTNAGGIWFAALTADAALTGFPERLSRSLLTSFFDEYGLYRNDAAVRPAFIAIVDDQPDGQPLYREMQAFASMFERAGIEAQVVDIGRCTGKNGGLYLGDRQIDMVYNRHCDFYLQTPATAQIRNAWLNGEVCLSPNPYLYGLLADKRRMILWSDSVFLGSLGLSERDKSVLTRSVPETRLMASLSPEQTWRTRKQWVFKPDTGYASRGVYVGAKLTRHKFSELDHQNTVVQQWIAPTLTQGGENEVFKTEYRLFAYRDRIHCVSARIYRGQVTNLHTEHGGFAKVRLVNSYSR